MYVFDVPSTMSTSFTPSTMPPGPDFQYRMPSPGGLPLLIRSPRTPDTPRYEVNAIRIPSWVATDSTRVSAGHWYVSSSWPSAGFGWAVAQLAQKSPHG